MVGLLKQGLLELRVLLGEQGSLMVDETGSSTDRDRQVNEIITAYLEAVNADQAPDRQE